MYNLKELVLLTSCDENLKDWDPFSRFINYKLEEVEGITQFSWLIFVMMQNYFKRMAMAAYYIARYDFFRFLNVDGGTYLAHRRNLRVCWSRHVGSAGSNTLPCWQLLTRKDDRNFRPDFNRSGFS